MNKRYKKMLATGLALNMMLINIPYNVFANSDMIENVILNEDNIPLIGEQSKSDLDDLINQDEQTLNDEDLIIEESDSSYIINNEITSELLKPTTEDYSIILENNTNENMLNSIIDFTEDKKTAKSTIPNIVNYADSFAGGNGTEESPYQISNALELARLAYLVNEEGLDTTEMYFELIDNIDLDNFDMDNDDTNGNWIPIGLRISDSIEYPFKGNFDGNNYTISNLKINNDFLFNGLFGIASNASFINLNLDIININGKGYVGSLIGQATDSVEIENINISNLNMINEGSYTGGLVGFIYKGNANISSININADINGMGTDTGGLIGIVFTEDKINIDSVFFNGDINTGKTAGGLISSLQSTTGICNIFNSKVKSNISSTEKSNYGYLGGIVGFNLSELNISNTNYEGRLESEENLTGGILTGGILGTTYSMNGTISIEDCTVIADMISNGDIGGVIGVSTSSLSINNNVINTSINGSSSTGGVLGSNNCFNGYINITNNTIDIDIDIDMKGDYSGGVIGTSTGGDLKIDNNTISGNIISTSDCGGVLGMLSGVTSALIKNNTIFSNITGKYSGGICGTSYNSSGINVVNNRIYSDVVEGTEKSGGILGFCVTKSIISNNFIKSNIIGNKYSGGFIGEQVGGSPSLDNNIFIGSVTDPNVAGGVFGALRQLSSDTLTIHNGYIVANINYDNPDNKGIVIGDKSAFKQSVDISNLYYDNTVYTEDDDLAIGLTTEQMQGLNARDNMPFDYDNIWKLNKEYYPTFEQLNTAPELSGSDIELIQNQEYNLLDYVIVEDFEDKDLIPEIETNLDITKIGNYTATFTVVDPGDLTDELTLNIKVVMESPVINAEDIEIFEGDEFDPRKNVTAIDLDGSDITEHIKVVENTVDTKMPGVYKVVYEVDSLYKSTVRKEIKVTVLEKENNNTDNDKEDNDNNNNNSDNKVENDKNESSTTGKPQTGDNFIVYGVSLLASLGGLLYVNRKKY